MVRKRGIPYNINIKTVFHTTNMVSICDNKLCFQYMVSMSVVTTASSLNKQKPHLQSGEHLLLDG